MTNRKFYKTRITLEILSEDPIPEGMDVPDIMTEATEGEYSAQVLPMETDIIDGKQAADALLEQGSDCGFFSLTEDGEDIE